MDKPNYPVILPHRRSTTASLETYPFYSFVKAYFWKKYYLEYIFTVHKSKSIKSRLQVVYRLKQRSTYYSFQTMVNFYPGHLLCDLKFSILALCFSDLIGCWKQFTKIQRIKQIKNFFHTCRMSPWAVNTIASNPSSVLVTWSQMEILKTKLIKWLIK